MNQQSYESLMAENAEMRRYIEQLETKLSTNGATTTTSNNNTSTTTTINNNNTPQEKTSLHNTKRHKQKRLLNNDQIARFSRHLLLPQIGVKGQYNLCKGSCLIVGAGGLGAPCAMYLAASGIGRLGMVDFDRVDTSNLHRQVIHNEHRQNMSKVQSAAITCRNLNQQLHFDAYDEAFNVHNARSLIQQYDVIVDASDNVSTRYLVNDACVLLNKPLVSGSAVRFEGQLTVYHYNSNNNSNNNSNSNQNNNNCPCYRCLFPVPPPAETVTNCADGGVMGVVPGVIGVLQALEVQKILFAKEASNEENNNNSNNNSNSSSSSSSSNSNSSNSSTMESDELKNGILHNRMLLFNAKNCTFKNVRLRNRRVDCAVCGDSPTITELFSYDDLLKCSTEAAAATTTATTTTTIPLSDENRISCVDYSKLLSNHQQQEQQSKVDHVLIDVRESVQYDIASLDNAINIPLKQLPNQLDRIRQLISSSSSSNNDNHNVSTPIYVMCRRGIASVKATQLLLDNGFQNVKNINGGVTEWKRSVDDSFPSY